MEKILIGVIVMGAFVSVNSLQCYQCNNCPNNKLKDENLVTCGAVVEPTTPATSTPQSSAATSAPQTSAATSAPQTSAPTSSLQTSAVTSAPQTSAASSALKTAVATDAVDNLLKVVRVRRHTPQEIGDISRGCKCNGIPCACDGGLTLRFLQYADATTAKPKTYSCAKISYTVNSTAVVERGCVENGEKEFCVTFQDLVNDTSIECKSCTTDKCNSAYPLQHSGATLLFIVTLTLFSK